MDRLNAMKIFVQVVESGSFSAAAGVLDMSTQNVAKTISTLEKEIRTRLIQRNTHSQSITEVGKLFYERAKQICLDVEDTESLLSNFQETPKGTLKIHAGNTFGIYALSPELPQWLKANPEVNLDITVTNRKIDLIKEGFDASITDEPLADSSLISRKICDFAITMAASPEYISTRGMPMTVKDLEQHTIIRRPDQVEWQFSDRTSNLIVHRPQSKYLVSNCQIACEMALNGLGITKQPYYRLRPFLESGRLLPVLIDFKVPSKQLNIVYPARKLMTLKLKRFIDFIFENFADGKLDR